MLEDIMPEKETLERAARDKRQGKAPTTQAGEFVREEMEHVRQGKHGARSTKQAIAIGLSKARRAGVKLPPPPRGSKAKTRQSAAYASRAAKRHRRPSGTRSRAIRRAARTKGPKLRRAAARRAARTRMSHRRRAAV
jgi:hypothetical protein